MRFRNLGITLLLFTLVLFFSVDAQAGNRRTYGKKQSDSKSSKKPSKPNGKEKPFDDMIKDMVKVEGLFDFYKDTVKNTYLMAINPEQIGPYYLLSMGRSAGDGMFYDTGPIGNYFPFYIKQVGKKLLFLQKNLRVRADSGNIANKAIAKGISDNLYGSLVIKSLPQDSTNTVLVDPGSLFLRDAEYTGYYLGQRARMGVSFDKKNSYYESIKAFPENCEIAIKLHFKSSQPRYGQTMQGGSDFYHTYHYSISSLPETDYVPRYGDERIGYFQTMYQDYSEMDRESAYIRYIDRWDLKKKNPEARISEPVTPIVYWIENTVPEEYRDAFAEGIEFWNPCFEKLGYRSAVIAKQMPDTADWDPLDVRYSTVRWMVSPGRTYAIGPSRANPFTGQIYDADISVSSDFIRAMFNTMENLINPVIAFDGQIIEEEDHLNKHRPQNNRDCNYASEMAKDAAFSMAYIQSTAGAFADKDSLTREYVHAYIVELIAHEIGHTLGFRHNFKASTIYSLEQLQDRDFTLKNSTVGTVMEYAPANLAPVGQPQGEFYGSVPGPYDFWRVEYGYKDFGAETSADEFEELQKIASKSTDPLLAYATDHDLSAYAIDPMTNVFDLGDDPLAWCEHKISLTKELWNNSIKDFEKPGVSYEKMRNVFQYGWRAYRESARYAAKYVGGIYHNISYVGDGDDNVPYKPVPASEQKRALAILNKYIFAADAFDLPDGLLNKLQSPQKGNFSFGLYGSRRDYPWHERVLNVQRTALFTLYNAQTLGRLLNNIERFENKADVYTMYDLFSDVRNSIWSEASKGQNINSYRRQLQLAHLNRIIRIYLSSSSEHHVDARTLASNDLDIIKSLASKGAASSVNGMTKAHYKEVVRQIEAAQSADRNFSIFGL